MKVTYNWLKDFVEIKISPKALADKLTMAGLEVTSLEERDGDFIFEIEITSNRPDCLSVRGIAREVAAVTGKKLKLAGRSGYPVIRLSGYPGLHIKIESKKDCPLYTAKIIKGVKVGSSPDWLKIRLELIGCRSVNNIVDITNYILFTFGEPLHAFDLDKLSQNAVSVRRAKANEKIITIDGTEKALNPDILVIADALRPVAIAGVMGGKGTEVTGATKNILLEAAVFNPIIIRRQRQGLGIQTDSSYRFERGIDLEVVQDASREAVKLIQELAGGSCVLAKSLGVTKGKKKSISLSAETANKILGINLTKTLIKKILNSLGFKASLKGKNNLLVTVPGNRADVNLEIDLIEEIARLSGYEFIPTTLPRISPQVNIYQAGNLVSLAKNILVGLGLNEAITYSLIDKNLLGSFYEARDELIEIQNPLSKEQEILRPSLIPGLSKCVSLNLNQKQDYINVFEIAKVFLNSNTGPKEELKLGIALSGARPVFLSTGIIKEAASFLQLKGILEALFERLGISDYDFKIGEDASSVSPVRKEFSNGVNIYANKENIGVMVKLKESGVFISELSLDKLFSLCRLEKKFHPLPKYPGVARDISFILKEGSPLKEIFAALREKGAPLLRSITLTDHYKGKQIPAGFSGLTISCLYRSDDRTLTEAEITPLHSAVCACLSAQFGAKIR